MKSSSAVFVIVFIVVNTVSSASPQVSGGQCAMFGLCGRNPGTGWQLPCVYNGPPKPLTDPDGRKILEELCPDFKGGSTCCDTSQLKLLKSSLDIPEQVLSQCPACLYNFKNIYCYVYCSPNQSNHLAVTKVFNSSSVNAIRYDLTTAFTYTMFNSCKDVLIPASNEKAIGLFCGRTADQCTPKRLLDYLGNTATGETPFSINFNITDRPDTLPSGITLHPMNTTAVPCSSPVGNSSACWCEDCASIPCPTTPHPVLPVYPCTESGLRAARQSYDQVPGYQSVSLVIQRRGHEPPIKHHLPPPSVDSVMFNAIFDKTFLHEILDLLITIQNMTYTIQTVNVRLDDVCLHGNNSKHCVIPSMLEYYQNSHKNIDKVAMDSAGFYVLEDYLDHAAFCFRDPWAVREPMPLNMSCLSDYGSPVIPSHIFCGFSESYYQNATAHVLSFIIKDPRMSEAGAVWITGLLHFVDKWQDDHKDVLIKTFQLK